MRVSGAKTLPQPPLPIRERGLEGDFAPALALCGKQCPNVLQWRL